MSAMNYAPDEAPTCNADGCTRPGIIFQAWMNFVTNTSEVHRWCLMHDPEDGEAA